MAVVAFNYTQWITRYPEFSNTVNSLLGAAYFSEAGMYCDNSINSIVSDDSVGGQRNTFLNMLTAHIAALNVGTNNSPSSSLVGRINSATEGSVSVQTQNDYPPGSAQWFQQTQYGAAFWQASAQYRTFNYIPRPCY